MVGVRFNWLQRHTTTASRLGFCDPDQLLQAPMNGGFRGRRPAFEREFPQRQRRMSKTELRGFSQARRELIQAVLAFEPAQRLPVGVSRAARAAEFWMVG